MLYWLLLRLTGDKYFIIISFSIQKHKLLWYGKLDLHLHYAEDNSRISWFVIKNALQHDIMASQLVMHILFFPRPLSKSCSIIRILCLKDCFTSPFSLASLPFTFSKVAESDSTTVGNSQVSPLNIWGQVSPLLTSDFQSQVSFFWEELTQRISESLLNIRNTPFKIWERCSSSYHVPQYLLHCNYTFTVYVICNQSKKENTGRDKKFWLATSIFYSNKIMTYTFTFELRTSLSHFSSFQKYLVSVLHLINEKLL